MKSNKNLVLGLLVTTLLAFVPVQAQPGDEIGYELMGIRLGVSEAAMLEAVPELKPLEQAGLKGLSVYWMEYEDSRMYDRLYVGVRHGKVCGVWLVLQAEHVHNDMARILKHQRRTRNHIWKDDFRRDPFSEKALVWKYKWMIRAFYHVAGDGGEDSYVIAVIDRRAKRGFGGAKKLMALLNAASLGD